jgi:hypothetical protein
MSDVFIDASAKDNVSKVFKQIGDNTETLSGKFKSILGPLAAIGASFLGLRKMMGDFQKAIALGGRLHELSRQTEESAGNLMILQRAFQNAGAGADTVGMTLARMNRFIAEANDGGKVQTEIMEKLGLSMDDLAGKTPTEQLQLLAGRLAAMTDRSARANIAMQLFGRSGAELIPLFRAMGVELENAKNQLGDAPGVADRTAQAFNTLGNNLAAIGEKTTELSMGLLEGVLPALNQIVGKLSEVNAAGFGEKIGEQLKNALQGFAAWFAAPEKSLAAFGLALTGYLLNAGNNLIAGFKFAGDWIGNFFSELGESFPKKLGAALIYQVMGFGMEIQKLLMDVFAAAMKLPGELGKAAEAAFDALDEGLTRTGEIRMQFKAGADAVADAFDAANKKTEFIHKDILGAGKALETASKLAQEAMEAGAGAIVEAADGINKFGEFQGPPMAPQARSAELVGPPMPSGSGTGGRAAAPRQLTNRERALMSPNEKRAADLESRGMFDSADRARQQGERKVEQQRLRDANRELQKDLGLQSGARMRPEDIARKEGKVSPLDRDAFKKRVKEIEQEIKDRAGQGDGTENVSGGGGPKKDQPTQSPLETLVGEIKSLVEKIEPKLPTAALTA